MNEDERYDENMQEDKDAPINLRIMCPAVMFAASRKDRVIGRTRILTVSIRIKAGDNQFGVLIGRRRAKVDFGAFEIAEIININHSGSP
jgi:hypothetical protein